MTYVCCRRWPSRWCAKALRKKFAIGEKCLAVSEPVRYYLSAVDDLSRLYLTAFVAVVEELNPLSPVPARIGTLGLPRSRQGCASSRATHSGS